VTRPQAIRGRNRKKLRLLWLIPLGLVLFGGSWAYRVLGAIGGPEGVIKGAGTVLNPRGEFPNETEFNILIAGKDYNHDSKDQAYTKDSRSDTIMLLHADLVHGQLSAVGVPRDTRVVAPDGKTGKINGTFQRGGVKLLAQTLEQLYDVHIKHTVVLKADAVKSIVDALGGVEVDPIDRMFYEDAWDDLKIDLPAGHQRVNGDQAVGFVRFRKSGDHKYGPNKEIIPVPHIASKEEGDIRRIDRQQQLIHAMISEVKRPDTFNRLDKILDVAFNQVETDLNRSQLFALALIFKDASKNGLGGASLPGKEGMVDGTSYWITDVPRSKLTLKWILGGDQTAGRQLARVVVYSNAAGRKEAKDAEDKLAQSGFTTVTHSSKSTLPPATEVVYHTALFEQAAKEVARTLGVGEPKKEPIDPRAYWIPDIKISIGAPSTATANSGPDKAPTDTEPSNDPVVHA